MLDRMRIRSKEERERDSLDAVIQKQYPGRETASYFEGPEPGAKTDDLLAGLRGLLDENRSRGQKLEAMMADRDNMKRRLVDTFKTVENASRAINAMLAEGDSDSKALAITTVAEFLHKKGGKLPEKGPDLEAAVYRAMLEMIFDYLRPVSGI